MLVVAAPMMQLHQMEGKLTLIQQGNAPHNNPGGAVYWMPNHQHLWENCPDSNSRAAKWMRVAKKERAAKEAVAPNEKPLTEGSETMVASQIPAEAEAPPTGDAGKDGIPPPVQKQVTMGRLEMISTPRYYPQMPTTTIMIKL